MSLGGGSNSSSSSSSPISPGSVSEYWRQAMSDIGMEPGRRSIYSGLTGLNTSGRTDPYSSYSVSLPSTANYNTTATASPWTASGYSTSGIGSSLSSGIGGLSGLGSTSGYTMPDMSSFGSSIDLTSLLGVDIPEVRMSDYLNPEIPIPRWKEFADLVAYPSWEKLKGGDYDRLEQAIYGTLSSPLAEQKAQDLERFSGLMAGYGTADDPARFKLQSATIEQPYATRYGEAANQAVTQRYGLESTDLGAYNTGMTARTDATNQQNYLRGLAENQFELSRSDQSLARSNAQNNYNLQNNEMYNSSLMNYWNQIRNAWLQQIAMWASMIKNQGESSGSGWGFNFGLPKTSGGGGGGGSTS